MTNVQFRRKNKLNRPRFNAKVIVFNETSERKHNWRMAKEKNFLASKRNSPSESWDTLWSAVLVGTWIWLGVLTPLAVGRGRLTWILVSWHWCRAHQDRHPLCSGGVSSRLGGGIPQALTLFGGARFITWCLRRLFLGGYRWVPRHFWNHQAWLGYGPTPGPS